MQQVPTQVNSSAQRTFVALWLVVTVIKVMIATHLPLFVDEAFYWQEGRHLAAAYSDLPGLTAWLARLGTEIGSSVAGGQHVLALRAPFLAMAALLPWLVAHVAARWYGEENGWRAGMLVLLMPLSGTLGLLALPDVPMALATILCLDAGARLLREIDSASALELASGLVIGALSHYRFVGVIAVGFIALLLLSQGRRVLVDARVWVALALGVAAWGPLLAWNLENADAGLRFQLVDRHPWAFQWSGLLFLGIQSLLVTPLLFWALACVTVGGVRGPQDALVQWRWFALLGGLSTLGYFALGFFADVERVSFHWPMPGYLALLLATPMLLATWPRWLRTATWALAGAGLVLVLGYYLMISTPSLRAVQAGSKYYPYNFAGWDQLAQAVREELAQMPPGTELLADNFKIGAELGFALDVADIAVLDHPINRKHGRAPQLRLWGLQGDGQRAVPTLLVASATDVKFRDLLAHYQSLCERVGALPPPRVVNADRGAQRFLLFRLPAERVEGPCAPPVLAHVDSPGSGKRVLAKFEISGWAIKDVVGVAGVTITLDGKPVAKAEYGTANGFVADFYQGRSRDPNQPNIGFRAKVDASALDPSGQYWLGLVVHGADGSDEIWAEQRVRIVGDCNTCSRMER
ncbi:MAG: glycosyltransferase family 39 protein [Pseudoxanthomonas sp.]